MRTVARTAKNNQHDNLSASVVLGVIFKVYEKLVAVGIFKLLNGGIRVELMGTVAKSDNIYYFLVF